MMGRESRRIHVAVKLFMRMRKFSGHGPQRVTGTSAVASWTTAMPERVNPSLRTKVKLVPPRLSSTYLRTYSRAGSLVGRQLITQIRV
jgi:hypothetical protein